MDTKLVNESPNSLQEGMFHSMCDFCMRTVYSVICSKNPLYSIIVYSKLLGSKCSSLAISSSKIPMIKQFLKTRINDRVLEWYVVVGPIVAILDAEKVKHTDEVTYGIYLEGFSSGEEYFEYLNYRLSNTKNNIEPVFIQQKELPVNFLIVGNLYVGTKLE